VLSELTMTYYSIEKEDLEVVLGIKRVFFGGGLGRGEGIISILIFSF